MPIAPRARVGLRVGNITKVLAANGPRVMAWRDRAWHIGSPRPFTEIELRYENAYGGSYVDVEAGLCAYDWNPIGRGFTTPGTESLVLPSLELAKNPLQRLGEHVQPGGLGFVPPSWRQRARYAGTFDDAWMRERRPLFPLDFDARFYNCVPQDQVLHPKLRGGEVLQLHGLHPEAALVSLRLERIAPIATFRVKDRAEPLPMVADTVVVLPDDGLVAITYRASCPLQEDVRYVRSVTFTPE